VQVYNLTPNKDHLAFTIEHVSTLALAFFFTDNIKYANRAREKANAWFLDPDSSMYPSLRVAGVIRGATETGRPQGIFDMSRLPDLLNGIILLEGSSAWSPNDSQRMRECVPPPPRLRCTPLCIA
jgi:unsaturated chondroitin disaccharide hydrolase